MKTKTTTNWIGGMAFDADILGHHVIMDADPQWGGKDKGPFPKPLLLAALSGCSGMDVVSILDKMKVKDYELKIDVEADKTEEHPVIYKDIVIAFHFTGTDLPPDKLLKAVRLSTEQYCGVNAMLKKAAEVKVQVFINEQEVQL
ncbi:MAG TPA: OsmC family protein [Candidatus Cloacimonadota bacterium]|nr:OsmC family protein [Candidatus Cloacimonadota bacterium]HPS38322.1 OsmC family protein [Candidatus Cloacimonadota bacterium]